MAGVLGNPLGYKNLIRNEEALDVAVEPGYYGLQASITVGSNTETVFGTLLVQSSPNYVIQIATGSAGIALMRRYDVGSSVWNAWTRLDNFGYNSLAELAGGVAGEMGIIRKVKNLLPQEEFVVSNASLGLVVISSNSSGNAGVYIVSVNGVIKIAETSNNFSSQIEVSVVDGGGIKVTNIHSVSRHVEVVIIANNGI